MRIARVRTTDFRPAASRAADGLDHLAAINRREQAEHDRAVAGYDERLLRAIGADLGKRHAADRGNPEQRWIMHRLAAVGRRLATVS